MADFAFVPGAGQGGWVWAEVIAALGTQDGSARAQAFDPPGDGAKRGRDLTGVTARDAAAEIADDLAASGLQDVALVGHSNAGTLLPFIAERLPQLIRRLVYVACIAPPPGKNAPMLMGMSRQGESPDEIGWPFDPASPLDMRERFRILFCNDMGTSEADAFLDKLGQDLWPTPEAIIETDWRYDHLKAVPTTYVVCLRDATLTAVWQQRFADQLHADRIVSIDAGHQAMITKPHGLAEILRHEAAA